jgi:hypothetical protein
MARQQPLSGLAESAGLRELTRSPPLWSIPNYLVIAAALAGVALAVYLAYGLLEL